MISRVVVHVQFAHGSMFLSRFYFQFTRVSTRVYIFCNSNIFRSTDVLMREAYAVR